jgi:sigma-B regulation protein RsbU (phosphoserine phosphatase)
MEPAAPARILVCASDPAVVADVCQVLEQAGHGVACHTLGDTDPPEVASYRLAVLEGGQHEQDALQFCRRLRGRLADHFLPILFVTADASPAVRLASFQSGADTYLLRPFAPGELLAQVQAFLRIKDLHDRLAEKTSEVYHVNKRLQQAYSQIDQELELARRIQLSFLPRSLPELPGARFAVHYRLTGRVGGDFYDVFRLDEDHVGFYVADAVGHGIPASLLTIFVKKGVRAKEIFGKQYRLLPPGEVLQRLNREMVEESLLENLFITMVYGLFNHRTGVLQFARAGHPHPLYLPRDGQPRPLQVGGSLLGVFDTEFPVQTQQLRPGDKVLLYSDGVDTAIYEGRPAGVESLLACAARHAQLPVEEFTEGLARALFGRGGQPDDLTLLGLEIVD